MCAAYFEGYKNEIQVYNSLFNSSDSIPTNGIENIVKYYKSNDGNTTHFTTNDYDEDGSDMVEIDIENIGKIKIDITDYISEIEDERETLKKCIGMIIPIIVLYILLLNGTKLTCLLNKHIVL